MATTVGGTSASSSSNATSNSGLASKATAGLGQDLGGKEFMQLLVAQLRAQDPLDPVKNENFIAQLAQLSTVDEIQKLNSSFNDLLSLQQLTQGSSLIGRSVVYETPSTSKDGVPTKTTATIQGLDIKDGKVQLKADGKSVPLSQVRSVLSVSG